MTKDEKTKEIEARRALLIAKIEADQGMLRSDLVRFAAEEWGLKNPSDAVRRDMIAG